jgi:serine/threonine-protein kinase
MVSGGQARPDGSDEMARVCHICEKEYPDDVTVCPDDGASTSPHGTAREPAKDAFIGKMVGSYKITRALGKGGMGAVYAGEHPAIGSKVAIKFLHPQYAADKNVVTRFFNEARAVNMINHQNIVQVVDYAFFEDKAPFFVMEYLGDGYSMSKLVGAAVDLNVQGPILLQLCDALAAAHEKGIIHRDLKPDNIYLAIRGGRKHFVKIMDFGIAKLTADAGSGQTQTGMVMGTPHYMSPEQAGGKVSSIGPGSDIYSLGIMMYQMATGQVPFAGDAFGEVIAGHLFLEPAPPRSLNPKLPEDWEQIILKSIAKKPEERWPSMRHLAQAVSDSMKKHGLAFELPLADGSGATSSPGMSMPTPAPTAMARGTIAPQIGGTKMLSPAERAAMGDRKGAAPARNMGARIAVMVIAFLIGAALPIALVKGKVIKLGSATAQAAPAPAGP